MTITIFGLLFLIIGTLMILLRRKRYLLFGYRTPRSVKSRANFIYANLVAGKMYIAFGLLVIILQFLLQYFEGSNLKGLPIGLMFLVFHLLLFTYIEINLRRIPKEDTKEE